MKNVLRLVWLVGVAACLPPVAPVKPPPGPPQRIVSIAPAMTEILFAIGAGPQVVGVTTLCDFPPETKTIPTVGGFGFKAIDPELILSRRPDLLVTSGSYQKPVADAIAEAGVPIFAAEPTTFAEVADTICQLGTVTGHSSEADAVAANLETQVATFTQRPRPSSPPRVLIVVGTEPLICAGPGTLLGQMVTVAGGHNIATGEELYPKLDDEVILRAAPEVILVLTDMGAAPADSLATRPGWSSLPAVKQNRIRSVPGSLTSRAGPRIGDGLAAVAAALNAN